jgi:hypothetical protein
MPSGMMTARAVPMSSPAPMIVMCRILDSDRVNVSGMMPEMNEPTSMVKLRNTTIKKPSILSAAAETNKRKSFISILNFKSSRFEMIVVFV